MFFSPPLLIQRPRESWRRKRKKRTFNIAGSNGVIWLVFTHFKEQTSGRGSEVFLCHLQITILKPKVQTWEGVYCFSKMISLFSMIGRVGTRYVSRDEREQKRWRRGGIGIASFIMRSPAISPASVIPHDLGGFSLRSKALPDKTVQIEFDRYRLLYSSINLVFAIDTCTSVLTLAVIALYAFNVATFSFTSLSFL